MAETKEAPRQLDALEFASLVTRAEQGWKSAEKAKENLTGRNEFMRGLSRGVDQLQGTYQGAVGMGQSLVGNDVEAARRFSNYQDEMRQSSENPATVDKFFSNDPKSGAMASAGNMGKWAAGTAGSLIPSVAESVVSGVAGAAAGAALFPAPDPADVATVPIGAIAGLFSKGAMKKAIAEAAEQYIKTGVKRETAEQMAGQAVRNIIAKRTGATLAAQQTTALNEGGGMWAEGKEKGYDNPVSALALGQLSGASEVAFGVFPASIRKIFGKADVAEVAKKSGLGAAAGYAWDIVKNSGEEGLQEAFQEGLGSINESINDPKAKLLTKDNFMKWVEAGAAGALGGGMFGVGGAAISAYQNRGQKPPPPPPGENRDIMSQNGTQPPALPTEAPIDQATRTPPVPADRVAKLQEIMSKGYVAVEDGIVGETRKERWVNAKAELEQLDERYTQPKVVTDESEIETRNSQEIARRRAAKAGTQPPIAPGALPTGNIASQNEQPPEKDAIGERIKIANTPVVRSGSFTDEDNIRHELFEAEDGKSGVIRSMDMDSGNVVSITKHPSISSARNTFTQAQGSQQQTDPASPASEPATQEAPVATSKIAPSTEAAKPPVTRVPTKEQGKKPVEQLAPEATATTSEPPKKSTVLFLTPEWRVNREKEVATKVGVNPLDGEKLKAIKAEKVKQQVDEEIALIEQHPPGTKFKLGNYQEVMTVTNDGIVSAEGRQMGDNVGSLLRDHKGYKLEIISRPEASPAEKVPPVEPPEVETPQVSYWDRMKQEGKPGKEAMRQTVVDEANKMISANKDFGIFTDKQDTSKVDAYRSMLQEDGFEVGPVEYNEREGWVKWSIAKAKPQKRPVRKDLPSEAKSPVAVPEPAKSQDAASKSASMPMPKTFEELEALPKHSIYSANNRFYVRGDGKRGGGDSIHDTLEGARKEAELQQRRESDRKAAQDKAKFDEEAAIKKQSDYESSFGGFLSDNAMNKGRQLNVLGANRIYQGKVVTVKDVVEQKVANGAVINDKGHLISPDGAWLSSSKITKIGIDYAKHLIEAKSRDTVSQEPNRDQEVKDAPQTKKGGGSNEVQTKDGRQEQTKAEADALSQGQVSSKGDQATEGGSSSDSSVRKAIIENGGHEKNSADDVEAIRKKLYDGANTPSHADIRTVMQEMKNETGQESDNPSEWEQQATDLLATVPAFKGASFELSEAKKTVKVTRTDGRETTIHFNADAQLDATAKKRGLDWAHGAYIFKTGKKNDGHIYLHSESDHVTVLNHEVVHWLEDEGIITPAEVEKHGGREGIADAYAEWVANKSRPANTLFEKIYDFLESIFDINAKFFKDLTDRVDAQQPKSGGQTITAEQKDAAQPGTKDFENQLLKSRVAYIPGLPNGRWREAIGTTASFGNAKKHDITIAQAAEKTGVSIDDLRLHQERFDDYASRKVSVPTAQETTKAPVTPDKTKATTEPETNSIEAVEVKAEPQKDETQVATTVKPPELQSPAEYRATLAKPTIQRIHNANQLTKMEIGHDILEVILADEAKSTGIKKSGLLYREERKAEWLKQLLECLGE